MIVKRAFLAGKVTKFRGLAFRRAGFGKPETADELAAANSCESEPIDLRVAWRA